MKRVFAALLVTSAVALGLGAGSSGFQNLPQQPAQNPQPIPPQPAPAQPAPAGGQSGGGAANQGAQSNAGGSSFLGKDLPFFDPSSNIITWDGKSWNITNTSESIVPNNPASVLREK